MARSSRKLPEGHFDYFLTSRCTNKVWFKRPLAEVWDIFSRYLHFVVHAHDIRVRAFVLMSNHYHLLASAHSRDLPRGMNYLLREFSRELNRVSGSINQVWGSPYDSSLIASRVHYLSAYKYLARNPVEAGLCGKVEEYEFSTIRGTLGLSHLQIPVHDDVLMGNDDIEATLNWLNVRPTVAAYRETIRAALRKRRMQFGRDRDRKPHPFDNEII